MLRWLWFNRIINFSSAGRLRILCANCAAH